MSGVYDVDDIDDNGDDDLFIAMLLSLLDRIELEQDFSLASQRFDIARQCGFTVSIGQLITDTKH